MGELLSLPVPNQICTETLALFEHVWTLRAAARFYFYFHHAVNFGAMHNGGRPVTFLLSEVGTNIDSINAHFAFLRGAARQYGVASWGVDVSPWNGGKVPDFGNKTCPWAVAASSAGGDGGLSVSLLRRIYFAYVD